MSTPTESTAEVEVVRAGGRSVVRRLRSAVPVGIREAAGDGSVARLVVVQTGALLLEGDHVEIRIVVGAGARAAVSDLSATVVHEATGELPGAIQSVSLEVGEGGRAVLYEQPLIISEKARVRRLVRIDIAADAVALHRDALLLGRAGEEPGEAWVRTRVERDGRPLLDETLDTTPASNSRDPAVLGTARVVASLGLYGAAAREKPPGDAFQIDHDAVLLRRLSATWRTLEMDAVAATWSQEVLGQ